MMPRHSIDGMSHHAYRVGTGDKRTEQLRDAYAQRVRATPDVE